jgi:hypothetical protein
MKNRALVTLAFAAVTFVTLGASTPADDNNIGTWTMNVAKSKYDPGPAPKSQTLKIEAWGDDGVKYVSDGIDADGKPTHSELEAKYDGKFYAFKGNPDSDMLAYKRVDVNTLHITSQLGGKQNVTGMIVISKDGKTRTLTQVGINAKGQKINNVVVYDRQ